MNIIELAEQAGLAYKTPKGKYWIDAGYPDIHLERFAELVAAAEREACAEHYVAIMRDAVKQAAKKEREACIKMLEDFSNTYMAPAKGTWRMGVVSGANILRARG